MKMTIKAEFDKDIDSKLGTYLQINPNLEIPVYSDTIFELERISLPVTGQAHITCTLKLVLSDVLFTESRTIMFVQKRCSVDTACTVGM